MGNHVACLVAQFTYVHMKPAGVSHRLMQKSSQSASKANLQWPQQCSGHSGGPEDFMHPGLWRKNCAFAGPESTASFYGPGPESSPVIFRPQLLNALKQSMWLVWLFTYVLKPAGVGYAKRRRHLRSKASPRKTRTWFWIVLVYQKPVQKFLRKSRKSVRKPVRKSVRISVRMAW